MSRMGAVRTPRGACWGCHTAGCSAACMLTASELAGRALEVPSPGASGAAHCVSLAAAWHLPLSVDACADHRTQTASRRASQVAAVARQMGMDPVYDSDLLWIAEELLLCPMPEAWQIFSDKSTARPYYYHCVERRSQWSHPMLDYFAGLFFMRKEGDLRVAEKEQATPATPAEVVHMCKYLHIDPRREPHLAHVARQAVNAPLPPLWEQYADDESGETVYYSKRTKVTTQQHPLDAYFLELAKRARAKWVKENPDGVPESYYRVGDYANLNTSFVPEGWMEFTDPASEVGARGRVCWYNFAKAEVAYVHPSQIVREELKLSGSANADCSWLGGAGATAGVPFYPCQDHTGLVRDVDS